MVREEPTVTSDLLPWGPDVAFATYGAETELHAVLLTPKCCHLSTTPPACWLFLAASCYNFSKIASDWNLREHPPLKMLNYYVLKCGWESPRPSEVPRRERGQTRN